ncbi:TlpA family protein disulfide reductase [Parafilimonas sp.]|uniref:TlpA family protein disulfide reductase n=1 Tax=Parafilimonas sp. TaxID=1969739 RepID=UPI0039E25BD7
MVRSILCVAILCWITGPSCTGEKGFKTTRIIVDTSFIKKYEDPLLSYIDLTGHTKYLTGNFSNTVNYKVRINKPTYLFIDPIAFFAYPREKYILALDKNGDVSLSSKSKINLSKKAAEGEEMEKYISALRPKSFFGYSNNTPIDTILQSEQKVINQAKYYSACLPKAIDSIAFIMNISLKRKEKFTKYYTARAFEPIYSFYFGNKVQLQNNKLFTEKINSLIPYINHINDKETFFTSGRESVVRSIINALLPISKEEIADEEDIKEDMRFVVKVLDGLAESFSLAYIMNIAIDRDIELSNKTYRWFYKNCNTREYRGYIRREKLLKKQLEKSQSKKPANLLIHIDDNVKTSLEDLIKQNRGKVILLHYWASWCIPCRDDIPYLLKLENELKDSDFISIAISIDKDLFSWKVMSDKLLLNPKNSYCINPAGAQPFMDDYIEAIPKYILINKNGEFKTYDAPEAKSSELKNLISKMLSE